MEAPSCRPPPLRPPRSRAPLARSPPPWFSSHFSPPRSPAGRGREQRVPSRLTMRLSPVLAVASVIRGRPPRTRATTKSRG
eukprot:2942629-Prymnesium_polylepis.1